MVSDVAPLPWTGLRREEIAALQWPDIDNDTISVRRARVTVRGDVIEKGPKTKASRRTVDLDTDTMAVLRSWRRRQLEERLQAGEGWEPGDWVFTDEIGRPWRPDHITKTFTRTVGSVGLLPTDIKGLRHAHATALLKAGTHPKVVQERLGHASIKITLDIYSSVVPGIQRHAIERLPASKRHG
jgi:integrase